jgi:hypothetical protein
MARDLMAVRNMLLIAGSVCSLWLVLRGRCRSTGAHSVSAPAEQPEAAA